MIAERKVLDLLRKSGKATNTAMTELLGGDRKLFERIREELILEDLAEDHKGAGLIYIGGPLPAAVDEIQPTVDVELEAKPPERLRIFMSYGHDAHALLAHELEAYLKERKHEVWLDSTKLVPGSDWERAIEDGLEWAAAGKNGRVILLMTPHSVRRPDGYCLNEVARAVEKQLSIVPVMLVQVEPPLSICRIQWLDLRDCIPLEERKERLGNKLPLLIRALEHDALDFEGGHSRILSTLKPVSFEADLAHHLRRFTGRRWLIDEIDSWLKADRAPQVLWITGSPGVGKTALACWLSAHRREIAAFHICRHGHEQKGDPRAIVRSIAWQLSTQLPEYFDRLKTLVDLREICEESNAATLFDRLIVEPLHSGFPEPDRRVAVLIDGLDEVAREGQADLVAFLTEGISRLPGWMRLILISRPGGPVEDALQGFDPLKIDSGSAHNENDIRSFLRKELRKYASSDAVLAKAVKRITKSSQGCFLYVEWIRRELEAGTLSLDRIDEFPKGLGGVYVQFFGRRFPNVAEYVKTYRPVLEVISAAQAPISLPLLTGMFEWSVYQAREIPAAFGALFSVHEDAFEPFHRSLLDWLVDPKTGGRYFVSTEEGHKRMADYGWQEYERAVDGLPDYMKVHLPRHLEKAGQGDRLVGCVTDGAFVYHYGKVGFLYNVAEFWREIDPPTLVRKCLESIERRREEPHRGGPFLALCGVSLGRLFQQRGDFDTALKCHRIALELSQPHVLDNTTARAHFYTGWCLRHMDRFSEAVEDLEKARDEYRRLGDKAGEGRSCSAIGLCYWHMQRDDLALRSLEEALRLLEKSNDKRHRAEALNHLGIVYRSLGQPRKALDYYFRAKRTFKKVQDLKGQGKLFNSIGTAHWWGGRPDLAFRRYKEADEINRTIDQLYVLGLTANNRGYLFLERGEHEKAREEFARARAIRQQLGSESYEMMDLSGMALAAFHAGDLEEARSHSRQAVEVLAKYEKVEDLRRAYFNHYLIFRGGDEKDRREAECALAKARQLVEERLEHIAGEEARSAFVEHVPLVKEILSA